MKNITLIISIFLTQISWSQISFPPQLEFEPVDIRLISLGVNEVVQYDLNYNTTDSINYFIDSTYYFQPDFIFNYDSRGKLVSMKYNFIQKPPPIILVDSTYSDTIKKYLAFSNKGGYCFENTYSYSDSGMTVSIKYPNFNYLFNCTPNENFYFDISNYDSLSVVNHFDDDKQLIKTEYFSSNNESVYSKTYIYSTVSNNDISYKLRTKVIETVNGIPFKETNVQYKF